MSGMGLPIQAIARAKINADEPGWLKLDRSQDGDIWVTVFKTRTFGAMRDSQATVRFCTRIGGGQSPNVRKALYDLMIAIQKDGGEIEFEEPR